MRETISVIRVIAMTAAVLEVTDVFVPTEAIRDSAGGVWGYAAQSVIGLAAVAAVLWRRPVPAALLAVPLLVLAALTDTPSLSFLTVALFATPIAWAVGSWVERLGVTLYTVLVLAVLAAQGTAAFTYAVTGAVLLVLLVTGLIVGLHLRQQREVLTALTAAREELAKEQVRIRVQLATDVELAVSQQLATIGTCLADITQDTPPPVLRAALARVEEGARETLAALRLLLTGLDTIERIDESPGRPASRSRRWWRPQTVVGTARLWWISWPLASISLMPVAPLWLAVLGVGGLSLLAGRTRTRMLTVLAPIVLAAAVVVQGFLLDRGATAAVLLVATAVCSSLVGLWGAGRQAFGRETDDQQHQLREERSALAGTERRRMARELHEVVGREITLITLHALRVRSATEATKMYEALQDIQRAVVHCRASLLRLVSESTPTPPTSHRPTDAHLDPARVVTSVAADLGKAGVEVDVDLGAITEEMSQAWCRSFARIVQEAGTNLARHGPMGTTASFALYQSGGTLVFEARNPVGIGRLAYSTGRGIRGMRERAALLDGSLEAGPLGDVWVVRVAVPLRGDNRMTA